MSTPFTPPADWAHGQDLACANELVLGYHERLAAVGPGGVSLLTAGAAAQDKTLWRSMQDWLDANCTKFVDHVLGPFNPDMTDFLYWTQAGWRAAAGIPAGGWTRKRDGVVVGYGGIEAGDDRNTLNFEELQAGMSLLRWTGMKPPYWLAGWGGSMWGIGSSRVSMHSGAVWDSWATVKADTEAKWDTISTWYSTDAPYCYSYHRTAWPAGHYGELRRCANTLNIQLPAATCLRAIDTYLRGNALLIGVYAIEFYDNGDSIPETLTIVDTVAETAAAINHDTALIGSVPASGVYPAWKTTDAEGYRGYNCEALQLIKWNFTNQT